MKKSALINADLSHLIATLGHTDEVTICDAGLPIPGDTQRIDLALIPGVPSFMDTIRAVLSEMQIEGVVMAEEFAEVSPAHHQALLTLIDEEARKTDKNIAVTYIPHEAFKALTRRSKAVIRTGECTPYANVIFQSGVVF